MTQHRIRPRNQTMILKDEMANVVQSKNADGSIGILVDINSPFWNRRLRDGDAVLVSDEDNAASISHAQALAEAETAPAKEVAAEAPAAARRTK